MRWAFLREDLQLVTDRKQPYLALVIKNPASFADDYSYNRHFSFQDSSAGANVMVRDGVANIVNPLRECWVSGTGLPGTSYLTRSGLPMRPENGGSRTVRLRLAEAGQR
jgi:hypothetical protein